MNDSKSTMTAQDRVRMQWNKLVVSCMADNGAQTTMVDWDKMKHLFNEGWSPKDAANWMIDVSAGIN